MANTAQPWNQLSSLAFELRRENVIGTIIYGSLIKMPWTPNDAERHTRKATTPTLKELWAKVANESLERTGDEGRAIREANAVVARQAGNAETA
jgi:hypothetical protein